MPGDVKPTPSTDDGSTDKLSQLGEYVREAKRSGISPADVVEFPPGSALDLVRVRLTRATTSSVETQAPVSAALLNQRGTVQGGIYAVIADAAAGWATEAFLGNDGYATTSVSSQLLGVAVEGDVLVTQACIEHGGRRTVVATARVYRRRPGVDDRLVALVTCQQLVVPAG